MVTDIPDGMVLMFIVLNFISLLQDMVKSRALNNAITEQMFQEKVILGHFVALKSLEFSLLLIACCNDLKLLFLSDRVIRLKII